MPGKHISLQVQAVNTKEELEVASMNTGCSLHTTGVEYSCGPPNQEDRGDPPHASKFAIDCLEMPSFMLARLEHGIAVSGGEELCGSLTYKFGKFSERRPSPDLGLTPVHMRVSQN